ncbi:MAG: electron transfer flavoprotein subunit beta/FixA family protein [Lutibacter sp.]|uniref:electron transfer flavoprotein subunit beta/FixA family protein n=1 Tax=Lutibacter sp. TaxID=1925666 RepID=UPI00184073A5|nr:electron transfer flavoprotein subunit beta/FixA family protein [Lutibacter sp.]MBT8317115.1 electron transfer flavoprotein subunit beta/FixA family protein [Lutibacter sp.]NNJ57975.1 electron transfer flavoprotein subunit beta/FixA family protein [Lutibacter sp.]
MRPLKIIVLAKQVPDTRHVGPDAMKPDGTVNRGKLSTVFNPDDLHALELALNIKDRIPGTKVTILTMGPQKAADIIREGYYRGVDDGIMISDRRFGGADTLATSYTIVQGIKKIADYDLIVGGRQAIDGDTAQVGPQCADKLNIPQVTYVEEILDFNDTQIIARRRLSKGVETVSSPFPCLMTVHGSSPECRSRIAKNVMRYKYARTKTEMRKGDPVLEKLHKKRPHLVIPEWSVEDIDADINKIGLAGSPTKVKSVSSIVLTANESKVLTDSDSDIEGMIKELIKHHTIG